MVVVVSGGCSGKWWLWWQVVVVVVNGGCGGKW